MNFKHGSLFSGIGGFDLPAEWMGWENVFHCEINPFCKQLLKYYWPNAQSFDDIKTTDFTIYRGKLDILTGGFPCQPYSQAGKRKGTDDERHLWPEMLRAIREIQPRWIVGENVFGLINWNDGLVFDEVQTDLEAAGYEVWPYVLPACAVNAPHRRDRVWFVAYASKQGLQTTKQKKFSREVGVNKGRTVKQFFSSQIKGRRLFDDFPSQSPLCNGNDGISARLDAITFPSWRSESVKGGGNAIVPPLVYQIYQSIEAYESEYLKPF
jgi:DNA (cytosine-5)-methyltransferase 1